jgi:transcriptional regulator with XRE-family HTH domain
MDVEAQAKAAIGIIDFDRVAIGSILKEAREKMRVTLKSVAAASGIAASHIWNVEQGGKDVSTERLLKLASFYGFPPGLLLEVGIVIRRDLIHAAAMGEKELLAIAEGKDPVSRRRRALAAEYIAGCGVILTYLLHCTRPLLLVEQFDWPGFRVKNRFRHAARNIEFQMTPGKRMTHALGITSSPLEALCHVHFAVYDRKEVLSFISLAEAGTLPFRLPWVPRPRALVNFDAVFDLPVMSVEEVRYLEQLKENADSKAARKKLERESQE